MYICLGLDRCDKSGYSNLVHVQCLKISQQIADPLNIQKAERYHIGARHPVSDFVHDFSRPLTRDPSKRGDVAKLAIDRGFPIGLMAPIADAVVDVFPSHGITLCFAASANQCPNVVLAAANE